MENYDILSRVVPDLARKVDKSDWLKYLELRREGVPADDAARRIGISQELVAQLETVRKCIIKWNGDSEKVARCIKGEIDP